MFIGNKKCRIYAACGVSQTPNSNYECGDVDIPTHILIKLAEFHNTSVDYLLNLTDDKRPYPRKKNSST